MEPVFIEGHDELRQRAGQVFEGLPVRIAEYRGLVYAALEYGKGWWLVVPTATDEWQICHSHGFEPCDSSPRVTDTASFKAHVADFMTGV